MPDEYPPSELEAFREGVRGAMKLRTCKVMNEAIYTSSFSKFSGGLSFTS
jgi:hypothetical protein